MTIKPTMDPKMLGRKLENCIVFGIPVIFEDATETFDPTLDPVLSKQVEKKGNELLMKFGEKTLNYSTEFQFFVTTKLPSPHYSPEVCVKVTMLNFMATQEGLLDQILNEIIKIEFEKKYNQRQQGIQTKAENAQDLARLQDEILLAITNASDDILEDTELKEKLDQSKTKCNEIEQSNTEINNLMKNIDKIREENKEVGVRVSRLFFVISDLQFVNPMYQYSLDFFKTIFGDTVRSAMDISAKKEKREFWIKNFTMRLYT